MEAKARGGAGPPLPNVASATATTTNATTSTTTATATATVSNATTTRPIEPAVAEPRRRIGGQKRKANTSSASAGSAKRVARQKTFTPLPHLHHNGPITRARQSPNKVAIAAAAASTSISSAIVVPEAGAQQKLHEPSPPQPVSAFEATAIVAQGSSSETEDLKPPLEAVIDAEFEAIRSRNPNAHVVPTPAAWFSWTKIHPLEERALASFFDGKSEKRTPDKYMEIRNLVMKKYHADPTTQIEAKDLAEISIGELDVRQEILEFLDHWGLINFHPFSASNSDKADANADVPTKDASLTEKLYRFEAVQPYPRVGPSANVSMPAIPPWLIPEYAIADEVRAEGPAVEYHCNSCSGDCSRKRFHCQKQADFDLCSECFNNGKFDSGMSPADFILMESAEVPGASGGSWTDQETLLLLEALELFGENWNEITEHVATKSKAQCILHFLQMPIEDTFLEGGKGFEDSDQGKNNIVLSDNCTSPAKDSQETLVDKSATSNGSPTPKESLETSKNATNNDSTISNDVPETAEAKNSSNMEQTLSPKVDIPEPKVVGELDASPETSSSTNFAFNVLKEAFQAVGFVPGPGESFSFAEAGNPVMALAMYLTGLVDSDVANATARSSLKSLSEDTPGIQLAARHCFLLEDPPDNIGKAPFSESANIEMVDQDATKNGDQKEESQQVEHQILVPDGKDASKEHSNQKIETNTKEKETLDSSNGEIVEKLHAAKDPDKISVEKDVAHDAVEDSSNAALPIGDVTKSDDLAKEVDATAGAEKKPDEAVEVTTSAEKKSDEAVKVTSSGEKKGDVAVEVSCSGEKNPDEAAEVDVNIEKKSDEIVSPLPLKGSPKTVKESINAAVSMETSHSADVPKAVAMVSDSVPSEVKDPLLAVVSNSTTEAGTSTGEDDGSKTVDCSLTTKAREDQIADKLKRAAVTALSAVAVKAKLFANQEEDHIRKLTAFLIEKQINKLETKMAFFSEMESMITRVREHVERSRQRLYHERAQIIAARLGLPASSSRVMPPSLPTSRHAMSYAGSMPKQLPRGPIQPSR